MFNVLILASDIKFYEQSAQLHTAAHISQQLHFLGLSLWLYPSTSLNNQSATHGSVFNVFFNTIIRVYSSSYVML